METTPFPTLQRFVRRRPAAAKCELCSADVPADHAHVLDLEQRQLRCACQACAILFSGQGNVRFRRVTSRIQRLPDFQMTDIQWNGLGLPVNLAFFSRRGADGRVVVLYPSPGGATEAQVSLDAWQQLVDANPVLEALEPEVEALLVYRVKSAREYYRLSIDECFRLVGLVRMHWRGISGGTEVWKQIERFFAQLQERGGHA